MGAPPSVSGPQTFRGPAAARELASDLHFQKALPPRHVSGGQHSANTGGPQGEQKTAPGADAQMVADVHEDQKQTHLTVEVKNLPPAERGASCADTETAATDR